MNTRNTREEKQIELHELIQLIMDGKADYTVLKRIKSISMYYVDQDEILNQYLAPYRFYKAEDVEKLSVSKQAALGYLFMAASFNYPGRYNRALLFLKNPAEQGVVFAQYDLGWIHHCNNNDQEAFRWYRLAAENGHARAQYMLALAYMGYSSGFYAPRFAVAKNAREAARWCQLAANQGDRDAQGMLASMYEWGKGVTQDYSKAAQLYRLANEYSRPQRLIELFRDRPFWVPKPHPAVVYHLGMALLGGGELKNGGNDDVVVAFQQLAKDHKEDITAWLDQEDVQTIEKLEQSKIIEPFFKQLRKEFQEKSRWERVIAQDALERGFLDKKKEAPLPAYLVSHIMSFLGASNKENINSRKFLVKKNAIRNENNLCKPRINQLKTKIQELKWENRLTGMAGYFRRNEKNITLPDGTTLTRPHTLANLWEIALRAEKDGNYTAAWQEIVRCAQDRLSRLHPYDVEDNVVKEFLSLFKDEATIQQNFGVKEEKKSEVLVGNADLPENLNEALQLKPLLETLHQALTHPSRSAGPGDGPAVESKHPELPGEVKGLLANLSVRIEAGNVPNLERLKDNFVVALNKHRLSGADISALEMRDAKAVDENRSITLDDLNKYLKEKVNSPQKRLK